MLSNFEQATIEYLSVLKQIKNGGYRNQLPVDWNYEEIELLIWSTLHHILNTS